MTEPDRDDEPQLARKPLTFETAFGAGTGWYPARCLERLDREDRAREASVVRQGCGSKRT